MPHRTPTARGVALVPPTASSSSALSPTPSSRKATALYRKRRRDWSDARVEQDEADDQELESMVAHPPPPPLPWAQRRPPPPQRSSWSSAGTATDRKDEDEDDTVASCGSPCPSLYREIQQRVDQVGAQVAQARRDVAELRALLLQAARPPVARPPSSKETQSTNARVRIDMLCS